MRFAINLAAAIAFTVTASPFASAGDAWDRMGRLWGYGWSDGYHACRDAPYVPGENLPPHGFAAKQAQCCDKAHCLGACSISSPCASGNCSSTTCASGSCGSGGAVTWGGSHDWLPETWNPSNLGPTLAEPMPTTLPSMPSDPGSRIKKPESLPAPQAEEDPLSWEKPPSKIGKFVSTRLTSLLR